MKDRFGHWTHLVRMAGLFVAAAILFLILRALLVPADFGRYGFFRAGALDDSRAIPMQYAGRAACAECHPDVAEVKASGRHAEVGCESCHGALRAHADDPSSVPARPDPRRTCLVCHETNVGKPSWFKVIEAEEHAPSGPCADCHVPHSPEIG